MIKIMKVVLFFLLSCLYYLQGEYLLVKLDEQGKQNLQLIFFDHLKMSWILNLDNDKIYQFENLPSLYMFNYFIKFVFQICLEASLWDLYGQIMI